TARALRGHVIDAHGLGDRVLQGRGDEAGDHVRIGTVIGRRHGDDGVLGERELPHRERLAGAQADHQDHQADDGRENRPLDEDIGEMHGSPPYWSAGAGWASNFGSSLLSTTTETPLRSLIWPATTTVSPFLTPSRIATWSPRVAP